MNKPWNATRTAEATDRFSRTCGQRERLNDVACWNAVVGARQATPTGCSSTACARPASTAGRRARAAGRGAIASPSSRRPTRRARAGFRACLRCKPDADGDGGRSLGREDPPRVRLPVERRGPSVARDAGRAPRRQPVSPAAQLQASGRRLAARVRRSLPAAARSSGAFVSRTTSPARCSTPATDRAAGSTSAPCRSSGWRRRSTDVEARACRFSTRSSIRPTTRSDGCSSPRRRAVSARWRWAPSTPS